MLEEEDDPMDGTLWFGPKKRLISALTRELENQRASWLTVNPKDYLAMEYEYVWKKRRISDISMEMRTTAATYIQRAMRRYKAFKEPKAFKIYQHYKLMKISATLIQRRFRRHMLMPNRERIIIRHKMKKGSRLIQEAVNSLLRLADIEGRMRRAAIIIQRAFRARRNVAPSDVEMSGPDDHQSENDDDGNFDEPDDNYDEPDGHQIGEEEDNEASSKDTGQGLSEYDDEPVVWESDASSDDEPSSNDCGFDSGDSECDNQSLVADSRSNATLVAECNRCGRRATLVAECSRCGRRRVEGAGRGSPARSTRGGRGGRDTSIEGAGGGGPARSTGGGRGGRVKGAGGGGPARGAGGGQGGQGGQGGRVEGAGGGGPARGTGGGRDTSVEGAGGGERASCAGGGRGGEGGDGGGRARKAARGAGGAGGGQGGGDEDPNTNPDP